MSSTRVLSVTESSTLSDCSWRWGLAYGDLAGAALHPIDVPVLLREGRAWGAGMAALHSTWDQTTHLVAAEGAIATSLLADEQQRYDAGLGDREHAQAVVERVQAALHHYYATSELLPLHHPETHLVLPLPAPRRHSNRYRLEVYLDGLHDDEHGTWIVEFKWRSSRLMDYEIAARQRQLRWYGWAWREHIGRDIAGVILDERLGVVPSEVRFNRDGQPSKVQSCTPEAYIAAGGEHPDVIEQLRVKVWQSRRRITFRAGELDWAGRELRTLARLVHQYDHHQLLPMRNPNERNCRGCRFKAICDDPFDTELVDALYERRPPKHLRELSHAA